MPELLPSVASLPYFSSCGQRGNTGPSSSQCNAYYTTVRDPDKWYKGVTSGIQRLVVPKVNSAEEKNPENMLARPFDKTLISFLLIDRILPPDPGWCQGR